jgi:CubicO group peptidase (beta-lactamase class C family)
MSGGDTLGGHRDAKFAAVAEVLRDNIAAGREVGAALAIYVDGKPVLDMWGGMADPDAGSAWAQDTIVCAFSVSKAFVATMGHMLIDRGDLDLDATVATYWPEFAQAGKGGILVRHLFDHRAALTYVDAELQPGDLYDWDTMTEALAASAPNWPPGETPVYMNLTFGYLLGEIVRRITGKRIGQFLREDLGGPLGLDYHFALSADVAARCAPVIRRGPPPPGPDVGSPAQLSARGLGADEDFNSAAWRGAEIGAGSGHGTARSIARLLSAVGQGGVLDGVRIFSQATAARAVTFSCESVDPVFGVHNRFALGYQMGTADVPMGPNPDAFGHMGASGGIGWYDPGARLAFAYLNNLWHGADDLDICRGRLIDAVFDAL